MNNPNPFHNCFSWMFKGKSNVHTFGPLVEEESAYEKLVPPFELLYADNPPWAYNKCDEKFRFCRGEHATFGMGMKFWFSEPLFGVIPGVIRTYVGFGGGKTLNPVYAETGGHTQCVHVEYDPNILTYKQLVKYFFANHDSSKSSYDAEFESLILYHNKHQKEVAIEEMKVFQTSLKSHQRCHTRISPARRFYLADNDHQKYILLNYPALMEALHLAAGKDMIYSHRATVINGFIAGSGTVEEFEKIKAELLLTPHVVLFLRKVVEANQPKVLDFPEYQMKLRL